MEENKWYKDKMKTKQIKQYLDLTTSKWKHQKQWNKVGLKMSKLKLPKAQKIANTVAAINMVIPCTAWPVTSPIIIQIGRKMSMKEKVKLK